MTVYLTSLLDPSRINLNARSTQRTAALDEIAGQLADHPSVLDYSEFFRSLLAKKHLDAAFLGDEIALPHTRSPHVANAVLAIGRYPRGIGYEGSRGTVRLMFVLGTTRSDPTGYLNIVGSLCRILRVATIRNTLLNVRTPEEFCTTLRQAEHSLLTPA